MTTATCTAPAELAAHVLLIDGSRVADSDPRWAAECLTRQRHVESLRALDLVGRRDYLEAVERSEGAEAARRVKLRYAQDWEDRRTAARAASREHDLAERVRIV